jgi:hypothetical protein
VKTRTQYQSPSPLVLERGPESSPSLAQGKAVPREVTAFPVYYLYGGTWLRTWLMQCAISREVAGSIPDGVIGIFH